LLGLAHDKGFSSNISGSVKCHLLLNGEIIYTGHFLTTHLQKERLIICGLRILILLLPENREFFFWALDVG
jgi:hypothetical protein